MTPTNTTPPARTKADTRAAITALGVKRKRHMNAEAKARAELKNLVVEAITSGALSQSAAAEAAGVDRMVVRDWLGIRRRTAND